MAILESFIFLKWFFLNILLLFWVSKERQRNEHTKKQNYRTTERQREKKAKRHLKDKETDRQRDKRERDKETFKRQRDRETEWQRDIFTEREFVKITQLLFQGIFQ